MRAIVRMCASFALVALVVVGFFAAVRVCEPSEARAQGPSRGPAGTPLVTAVSDGAELVSEDNLPGAADVTQAQQERNGALNRAALPSARGQATADASGLELHHLSAWDSADGSPYVYVSFMPISLELSLGEVRFRRTVVEGEEVDVADIAPVLDETHVGVELDGSPAEVASLQWYYAGYGDLGGADMKYMPVCLVQVERPDLPAGEHDVHVVIEDVETGETGEGSSTFECGGRSSEI